MVVQDDFIQGPTGGDECQEVCIKEFNPGVTLPVDIASVEPGVVFPVDLVAVDPGVSIATTPSGLRLDFRVTTMIVTDVAQPLPAVPLTKRNAISITNQDAANTLYIGKSTVTADAVVGTTSGWETGAGESFNVDITDSIILYGIAPAGQTILVKILEIS